MDQNIIGLVLKTGGYSEPVTVSGCLGNQVKFKVSLSKKFLISLPKNGLQTKFLHLLVGYGHIYEAYDHFNSWKPFTFDRDPIKNNSLFRNISKTGPYFATRSDKFFPNFAIYNYSSKVYHFTVCLISPSVL